MSTVSTERHIVIGGTTKAATTSLFGYLGDHPGVCPSSLKEVRFFLDADYPVHPLAANWLDGLERYADFFPDCTPGSLRLEATPDYLYSPGSAERIAQCLPRAQMIFILREPVSRLVSWHRYARQRGLIARRTSFEEYAGRQLATASNSEEPDADYFYQTLRQGRYADYLAAYFDALGEERILVILQEDLQADYMATMSRICAFAELDEGFYSEYRPQQMNVSYDVRSPGLLRTYESLKRSVRRRTHNLPLHQWLRRHKKQLDSLVRGVNRREEEPVEITTELQTQLADYYRDANRRLAELLERELSW